MLRLLAITWTGYEAEPHSQWGASYGEYSSMLACGSARMQGAITTFTTQRGCQLCRETTLRACPETRRQQTRIWPFVRAVTIERNGRDRPSRYPVPTPLTSCVLDIRHCPARRKPMHPPTWGSDTEHHDRWDADELLIRQPFAKRNGVCRRAKQQDWVVGRLDSVSHDQWIEIDLLARGATLRRGPRNRQGAGDKMSASVRPGYRGVVFGIAGLSHVNNHIPPDWAACDSFHEALLEEILRG
jgi:hypothetical protein